MFFCIFIWLYRVKDYRNSANTTETTKMHLCAVLQKAQIMSPDSQWCFVSVDGLKSLHEQERESRHHEEEEKSTKDWNKN